MIRIPNQKYYMAETEVTQGLWQAVMGKKHFSFTHFNTEIPVVEVKFDDIVNDFLPTLNKLTGKTYRLPTEDQWEYSAKGGENHEYAGSDNIDEVAFYGKKGFGAYPVKKLKPNRYGLYDMSGNVYEWCLDDWHGSYKGIPTNGSAWIDSPRATNRVLRGGSWSNDAAICRVAYRNDNTPDFRNYYYGFRLSF